VTTAPARAPAGSLARSTAAMSGLTALSRATGFVRVLVVAAVLGTTFLGNTYQSANTVPNLLFELLAAGALQAAVIPVLVDVMRAEDQRTAEHVAGSILGLVSAGLAAVAVAGMLAAPLLMRVLVAGVDSENVRDAQVELGTFFLWFFLPQVVLYGAAMVSTGVLNARDRFAVPVFAPVVNNVVVVGAYGLFWLLRDGAEPSLDLTTLEKVVLAGGTTLAVIAFCAVPVVAVVRSGFSLRPRFDFRHPVVRRVGRMGGWAAVYLAMTQVLLAVVLVLGNGVEGGVVAYQVALTFFLLPHALFAVPVLTTLFPRMSRQSQESDWEGYASSVGRGLRLIAFFALPATAAFLALAPLLADVALFGATAESGTENVAAALRGFAPGLIGYGAFLFLTRAWYATGDARTPALVNVAVAVGGSLTMAAAFSAADGERIGGLAVGHSVAYLGGSAALLWLLRGRLAGQPAALGGTAGAVGRMAVAAVAACAAMWPVADAFRGSGTIGQAVGLAVSGLAGVLVYVAVHRAVGGHPPARLGAVLRRGTDV
jgi:putative peptidoglycan lipid II flippase